VNSIDKCVTDIRKLVECNTLAKLERFLSHDLAGKVDSYTAEDFLVPYAPSAAVKLPWAMYCHQLSNWCTLAEHPRLVDCRENVQSHEIFPKKWLSANGAPGDVVRRGDTFAARTFISGDANGSISAKSPATYLKDVDPGAVGAHGLDYASASTIQANQWREILEVTLARAARMADILNSSYMTTTRKAPTKRKRKRRAKTAGKSRGQRPAR